MRELRLVLLCLAAAIALLLGTTFLMRALRPTRATNVSAAPDAMPQKPVELPGQSRPALAPTALGAARSSIERAIADTPEYAHFFDRLRLVFPSEYESIMTGLAQANAASKDVNVDAIMADTVAALRRSQGGLAAQSSDTSLEQIFAWQLKELQALAAKDTHLCVAFLYEASGAGFQGFAADHRPLVADAAIAGLDAMNSGRMDQVKRAAPTDADFQALDHALVEKGLSRPEIEALLDGKSPEPPIGDPAMCEAGQTYLKTLATLPDDVKGRLYALMARS